MLISFALFIVAIGIFYSGSVKIYEVLNGRTIERPTYLALIMAAVSIVVKEGLYWYTIIVGRKIDSPAVIANGWHHRSDAFSSIGTLIGISGAMFLGERWRILDPITSVIVGIFIVAVACKLARPSIQELLEVSLPKEIEAAIKEQVKNNTRALAQKKAITVQPIHVFPEKIQNLETAFEIFKAVQERENLAVTKLRREDGKDILPPTLYVTEADTNTILVIAENKMFLLDGRVYQVTNHYRRGVAEIQKIENGEITAQYR